VQALHAQWLADRAARSVNEASAEPQAALTLLSANEVAGVSEAEEASAAQQPGSTQVDPPSVAKEVPGTEAVTHPTEPLIADSRHELALTEVVSYGTVQHVGSWILLGLLNKLGVYDVAARCGGNAVTMPSLRLAMDAVSPSPSGRSVSRACGASRRRVPGLSCATPVG